MNLYSATAQIPHTYVHYVAASSYSCTYTCLLMHGTADAWIQATVTIYNDRFLDCTAAGNSVRIRWAVYIGQAQVGIHYGNV